MWYMLFIKSACITMWNISTRIIAISLLKVLLSDRQHVPKESFLIYFQVIHITYYRYCYLYCLTAISNESTCMQCITVDSLKATVGQLTTVKLVNSKFKEQKKKFLELWRTSVIKKIIEKISIAFISVICCRLSRHNCHKLPFHML
jgi:hypothetical protein